MTSSDAQKSEVHDTTDDAASSPAGNLRMTRPPAPAAQPGGTAEPVGERPVKAGPGDSSPDPEVEVFPGQIGRRASEPDEDEESTRNHLFPGVQQVDEDESDFGGPMRVRTSETTDR